MSVPTHNLYDFVHQVAEKGYLIFYFYPFGHKHLNDIVCYQSCNLYDDQSAYIGLQHYSNIEKHKRICNTHNTALKIFPDELIDLITLKRYNKVLLCHDQEPLNFDYYEDYYNHKDFIDSSASTRVRYEIENTSNLRWCHPNSLEKKWILLHSELNSQELKKYESTGNYIGAYWWSHAMLSLDWYRFAKYDLSLNPAADIKKLFLIYCRDCTGTRQYRKNFLDLLTQYQIESYQIGSFLDNDVTSNDSATYNCYDFNNSGISVVLETVFDQRIHLTEKTLRPIACGHPFILAAGPKSLEYLRSYGFKTFSPWINESYDNEPDAQKRLNLIADELKRIENLPTPVKNRIIEECLIIAEHNKKLFFSQEFENIITEELALNIDLAKKQLVNNFDWQKLKIQRMQVEANEPGAYDSDPKTVYIEKLLNHCEENGTLENYVPLLKK